MPHPHGNVHPLNAITIILNLRHSRPTFPDSSQIRTAAVAANSREYERSRIAEEAEEEERIRGLSFAAAFSRVVGAICDLVLGGVTLFEVEKKKISAGFLSGRPDVTYAVATAMSSQLRCERHSAAEEEEHVQSIHGKRNHRMSREPVVEGSGKQVDEREHGEDGDEHAVVDDGGVTGCSVLDCVADQSHDEESPEELFNKCAISDLYD